MAHELRELFQIPDDVVYLNASYMSPLPVSSAQAGVEAIERRTAAVWETTSSEFTEPTERLRATLASLWGTLPGNIAIVPSVSYGVETAVRNFPLREGAEILIPADDFPSNVYPWLEAAKRTLGARVILVPRPYDSDWTRAMAEWISPRTSVISVPSTDWSDGTRFDLPKLSRLAKDAGALFIVDVSQSFGAVPFAISDFDPDFLFSVGYKWQLGPYGLSYLYVADRWHQARPLENNWLNRRGSEDFSRLVEYQNEYQEGARRFDGGERSQFQLTPIALESMKLLHDISVPLVHAHLQELVHELHAGLTELGFQVPRAELLSGHMIGARHRNWPDMAPLVKRLRDRRVFVSARGNALRVSPHFYNDREDITRFFDAVSREIGVVRSSNPHAVQHAHQVTT